MSTIELQGRVALITGAGRGIGLAVAQRLAEAGAAIAINDVLKERLDVAVTTFPTTTPEVMSIAADVTNRAEVTEMVAKVARTLGSVDVLVNNAGMLRPTKLIDIAEEEWDAVIEVNLKGTFLCSQAVLPLMQDKSWGRIVNMSSTAGKSVSTVGGAHYTAAKAGVLGLTRHLASEVAADGITVNAVCPGLIDTEMVRTTINSDTVEGYVDSFPIARLGRPSEVAEVIAFLVSDRAEYITGSTVDINGGDLMT